MKNLKKILSILSVAEKKQALLLLIMILIMAFFQMLGVASILPFIAVLTNPEIIETNSILKHIFQLAGNFGIVTKNDFIYALGLIMFVTILVSLSFKAFTNYRLTIFITMREYSISKRLIEGYINQPYSWFLNRHSADLSKTIYTEVGTVIGKAIQPFINLIAHGTVAFSIILLLLIYEPFLTLISSFIFGGVYGLIYMLSRNYLKKIGKERVNLNTERFIISNEAFAAIKELKLGGLEKIFLTRWIYPAKKFAKFQASFKILSEIPRYIVEIIAFGSILLLILYFLSKNNSFISILPAITFVAFAGYRLVPAFQNIFLALTQLRFAGPAVDALYEDIKSLDPGINYKSKINLLFNNSITLSKISYKYPKSSKIVLNDIQLEIPFKSKVGIVGITGSGKTTLVDIILGLLSPTTGTLKVDEKIISDRNIKAWQSYVGYVPQNIFLADDTIAANIAFGVSKVDIDEKNVESAAKIANLHEFINNNLPEKYNTTIGERGVRLSGGQRQRIGIARALYKKPKVLILDEATSSLDNITEEAIINSLNFIDKDLTVIFIAHRLTTLRNCDTIFLLEDGNLVGKGPYNNLKQINGKFEISKTRTTQ